MSRPLYYNHDGEPIGRMTWVTLFETWEYRSCLAYDESGRWYQGIDGMAGPRPRLGQWPTADLRDDGCSRCWTSRQHHAGRHRVLVGRSLEDSTATRPGPRPWLVTPRPWRWSRCSKAWRNRVVTMPDLWTGPPNREEMCCRLGSTKRASCRRSLGPTTRRRCSRGAPKTLTPWPSAGRQKKGPTWRNTLIQEVLSKPPELHNVDPRALHATQPNIVGEHVTHYLGDAYEKTGRTAADQHEVGNQYPVVYAHPSGRWDILSGHHRATAKSRC